MTSIFLEHKCGRCGCVQSEHIMENRGDQVVVISKAYGTICFEWENRK